MKRHNWRTGKVYDIGDYMYEHTYDTVLEEKQYWKLPQVVKVNFINTSNQIGSSVNKDVPYFYRDINNEIYFSGGSSTIIPFCDMAGFLCNGSAEPIDTNINRVGIKFHDWSLLNAFHRNGNAQCEESKKYWSEETKKDYKMENFKIQSVTVSKIENGYLVSKSYYHNVAGKQEWNEDRYYCVDLNQVTEKLEEIYK